MIVLSGCRTGSGKEIKGEGLVGLTRGFMYAGAKRVTVSLWEVSDEATSELMARFHREMLGDKKPACGGFALGANFNDKKPSVEQSVFLGDFYFARRDALIRNIWSASILLANVAIAAQLALNLMRL